MSFLYNLHFSLAAPSSWTIAGNNIGGYVLGVTAPVWTIDGLIALYLAFPLRLRWIGAVSRPAKTWWTRGKPAWLNKMNAGFDRFNFDIHRAFGLRIWGTHFIFAWSSVGCNLNEVDAPAIETLLGAFQLSANAPARTKNIETPTLSWREALAQAERLLRAESDRRGLSVEEELNLSLNRDAGVYELLGRLLGDGNRLAENPIRFDADTGALTSADFECDLCAGEAITNWVA